MESYKAEENSLCSHEHWRPKIVASLTDRTSSWVKVKGISRGTIIKTRMRFSWFGRAGFASSFETASPTLVGRDPVVLPRVEHRTAADEEAEVLVFEPADVRIRGTSRMKISRHRRCGI